ncbi:MAG TPA: ATP-binding protein [Marmoricola sp.]|nr:ATP-binding protein [Marmoricola sp.]
MTRGSPTLSRRLAPHPASVGEGRRFIRKVLEDGRRDDLCDAAELVVSEVVTNALVHAGTEVQIAALLGRDGVRVEVSDGSPHLPATKNYADLAATGRGLQLLEQMVDRWGVDPHDEGKTVWFELGTLAGPARGRQVMEVDPTGPAADTTVHCVDVELLGVPLLLHSAWQMQAESLLREYLLSRLDDDNGTYEIERHAAASDAMALLQEQVPAPLLDEDPEALMAAAVEPYVSAERVVVSVPAPSVPHFALLAEILETATDMADAGTLLTPPTQPEVQSLRRWLCSEVVHQSDRRPPQPWDADLADASPPRVPAEWDSSVVSTAVGAMLAADDTNRILAVSPAAVALLGYGDASELVLRRLVEIIPRRYRQAHLAGFTLHLFAGRGPLLSTTVLVPALRRDGSEITVEMRVSALRLPEGRRAFIAELSEPAA